MKELRADRGDYMFHTGSPPNVCFWSICRAIWAAGKPKTYY
jgi:hypothetical protein